MEATTYHSLDSLAVTLGLPRRFLREQVQEGQIPYLKIGGRLRFDEGAVREALRELAARRTSARRRAGR
jgi:excisionase family DNA binding protein